MAAPEREIGLLVRAGALAGDDALAVTHDEKLPLSRLHGQDRPGNRIAEAAHHDLGHGRRLRRMRQAAIACGRIGATAS